MQVVGPRRHSDAFTLAAASAIEKELQTHTRTRRPIPDINTLSAPASASHA